MHTSTKQAKRLASATFRTQWGTGLVSVCGEVLAKVELPGPGLRVEESRLETASADTLAALERWVSELEAYFRGERLSWSREEVPLDFLAGTPLRRAVYEALLDVPPGTTLSYGRLAAQAGYERAYRAVGSAMAANPVPVVIPCHRVILADGRPGNYGHDPAWKERLLVHERSHFRPTSVTASQRLGSYWP